MSSEAGHGTSSELLRDARFEIGNEDLLQPLRARIAQEPEGQNSRVKAEADCRDFLADVHIRIGTLLKADTVSFLLGAGASVDCGGVLIGSVPLQVERVLLDEGIIGETNPRIRRWVKYFYLAVRRAGRLSEAPTDREEILRRVEAVKGGNATVLTVNFESLLALLHRWRSALPAEGGRLRLDGNPSVDIRLSDIDECLRRANSALAQLCKLPADGASSDSFQAYRDLVRKILTRPLNLKRVNVFTLNYDTLMEQAADAEGIVLLDGFVGTARRVFRPESYDQDLYFPAETTEGRVHRLDRVLHLYKLHGSITWTAVEPDWENPYGVVAGGEALGQSGKLLIYPTPAKDGETLGMPYAELFRRFAAAVVRPQSVLFVLGYGFGDEHVKAIIRQALAIPSFTLVIVDPDPKSKFVEDLRRQEDRRVWTLSGKALGGFSGFVERVLPDLQDEEVRRKVMATHRALQPRPEYAEPEERAGEQ